MRSPIAWFDRPAMSGALRALAFCAALAAAGIGPAVAAWTPSSSPGAASVAFQDRPAEMALASAARLLAVGTEQGDGIQLVDPDAGVVKGSIRVEKKPIALAITADGARVFALLEGRRALFVYDTATRAQVASWPVKGDPVALAVRAAGAEAVIADREGRRVVVLSTATGAELREKALAAKPQALSANASGTRLAVPTDDGRLVTLDGATLAAVSSVALGAQARWVGFWDQGGFAVVVQNDTDAVSLVNVETGTVVTRVEMSTDPQRAAVDPVGSRAYVTTADDLGVNQVDLAAGRSEGRFILPTQASAVVFDSVARKVYVSLSKDKAVYRIDPAQHPLLAEVVLRKRLRDIAVSNATHEAATLAEKSNELARVRLEDRAVDSLTLADKPALIAVDAGRNLAALAMKDTLRFADLATRPPTLLGEAVTLAAEPVAIAADAQRGLTLVAAKGGNAPLQIVDNVTRRAVATIATRERLAALAVDARRGVAYASTGSSKLLTIDLVTRSVTRTTALAFQADAIAVDGTLNRAIATDASKDRAYVLDLATMAVLHTLAVPRGPVAVAVQEDTHLAVVLGKEADQVSLVDLSSGAVTPGYATLESPFALAISIRFNQALVLSGEKDDIAVVPLPNAAPGLESIEPAGATAGDPQLVLTLRGSHFVDRSRALFGSSELQTRWIAADRLEAVVPASLLDSPGGGSVKVRNPGPGGGDSNAITFTVAPRIPPLSISGIDPASGGVGTSIALFGVSFDPVAANNQVRFTGGAAATVSSATDTRLVAVVPAGAQSGPITVSNSRGSASSPAFTVIPPPSIAAISPASGAFGATVVIDGTGFAATPGGNQVTFGGGVAATISAASTTQLTVTVPPGAQSGPVTVTTAGGSANSPPFTVIAGPPVITGMTPASGPPGTLVTLTGVGFNPAPGAMAVGFFFEVAPIVSISPTTIVVRVPAIAPGSYPIVLLSSFGLVPGPTFAVTAPPPLDVQLLTSPAAVSIYQSAATTVQVQMGSTGAEPFNGVAVLSVTGLPPGITARFAPAAAISTFQPSTLVLEASATASTGDYTLTVSAQATAGSTVTRTGTVSLRVLSSAGVTGVKGRFITPAGAGIAGVVVRADNGAATQPQTTTDSAGNFQLVGLAGGAYTLRFDATPANPLYPIWPYSISVEANRIAVIPDWTINPPPSDDKFKPIANAAQDQVITDARFPGFEIRLPAGVTITGWDGVRKTRIAAERIDMAKLPVTPPPATTGNAFQLYFGTPMGGIPSQPIPVTLPNDVQAEPGEAVDVWFFDGSPMGGSGEWKVAGQAIVSADGKSAAMPNGTGIPRFCGVCGLLCLGKQPPAPQKGKGPDPCDGNPVALSTGQEMPASRGMSCGGLTPIDAGMSYNPVDAFNGIGGAAATLGFGWTSDYDISFLPFDGPQKRLVLPGNSRVNFVDVGGGVYKATEDARFDGATIRVINAAAHIWELRFADARVWRFRPYSGINLVVRGGPPTFVSEMVDAQGNTLAINRNSDGKLASIGSTERNISFVYGANGFASEMRDTAGRAVRFTYTGTNRLSTVSDPDGRLTRYTYVDDNEFATPAACGTISSLGERLKTITYPGRPNPTVNHYGPGRRVLRQVGYDGRELRFSYRVTGACVTHVSSPNTVCSGPTCPLVDSWENFQAGWRIHGGRIVATTVVRPEGQTYTVEFDADGLPLGLTDAAGQKTATTYDSSGRPVRRLDALGRSHQYFYDDKGNLVRTIDPLGRESRLAYDPVWQKATSLTRFDDSGQPVTLGFAYHPQTGNLVTVTDPLGRSTHLGYTARGQLETITNPLGKVTRFQYDSVGDLVRSVDPLGRAARMGYDAAGRRTSLTDPLNFVSRTVYDGSSNVTRVTDALLKHTDIAYDAAGRIDRVTNARGNTVETYGYDAGDRMARKTDAHGKSHVYEYDASGRISRMTDRKGAVTTFTYDSEDRLLQVTRPEGATRFSYDVVGRLVLASDPGGGSIAYEYDAGDRLIVEKQTASGSTTTIRYQYDALDRRTSRSVSGVLNETTTYGYDRAGRLTRITYRGANTTFEYDDAGRLLRKTLPNGIVQALSYDDAGHLSTLRYTNPDGSVIESVSYGYDENSRRTSETRSSVRAAETLMTASYDVADRLASLTLTGGETFTLEYDANGNLARKIPQSSPANATLYIWDSQDRLQALRAPGIDATFAYDATGRRISRTLNGVTTRFLYDASQAIAEIRPDRTDTILATLHVDEVIARYSGAAANVYLTDALNSVLAQTAEDRSVRNTYAYSAYGEAATQGADGGNAIQYTGRENDGTGLYFYRARYYDPILKRFVSEDPIGLGGGANPYLYVDGNPTNLVDPSGELPIIPILIGIFIVATTNSTTVQNAARDAARYWADRQNQTGNPVYGVPGAAATLLDPCNAWKTGAVLGVGAGAAAHAARPFWQYYPAGNPAYQSPWLTRNLGWKPPYAPGTQAAERLALPPWNPGTAVRPVNPGPFEYVAGPRPVQPNYSQPGGGIEYRVGGWPKP